VVLANFVYYIIRDQGQPYKFGLASSNGKRDLSSVQWETLPEDVKRANIASDAEKRDIVYYDQDGNDITAEYQKRDLTYYDKNGRDITDFIKRNVADISSRSEKGKIVVADEAGNEISSSEKREIIVTDEAGNEISSSEKRKIVIADEDGNEISSSEKREVAYSA
jgi:adenosyl cobinamide kinase/adenosyl cobinamide phosphate guanylyltransferase